jgi:hypothetical protein
LNNHVEIRAILFSRAPKDRQEVGAVWHAGRQKHNQLVIRRADDGHREGLTPHLRRLRAKSDPLHRQRLIRPVDGGAQNDELVRLRNGRGALLLGIRRRRPKYDKQQRHHHCAIR